MHGRVAEMESELQEIFADKVILPLELQSIYDGTRTRIDDLLVEAGFFLFYEVIGALFEDDDDDDDDDDEQPVVSQKS
jgi:hypothetical protein